MYLIATLCVCVLGIGTAVLAHSWQRPVSQAASSAKVLDVGPLQKNCSVLQVQLQAKGDPTTKCLSSSTSARKPNDVYRDDWCGLTTVLEIFNTSSGNVLYTLCFAGAGYTKVAIGNANEAESWVPSWVGTADGSAYPLDGNMSTAAYHSFGSGRTGIEVTQICLGNTDTSKC